VLDGGGLSLVKVQLLSGLTLLAGAIHLTSKLNANDDEQHYQARNVAEAVRSIEARTGIGETILIGDFNMNPFEKGMSAVDGFNAVMDRAIAARVTVTHKGKQTWLFYNPMWSFLGDASEGPPGTFYYSQKLVRYYWNMYDQVLLRPSLLNLVHDGDIKIVDRLGASVIAGSGQSWKCKSDHLPIYAKIRG
jgi:hypothetical protein